MFFTLKMASVSKIKISLVFLEDLKTVDARISASDKYLPVFDNIFYILGGMFT